MMNTVNLDNDVSYKEEPDICKCGEETEESISCEFCDNSGCKACLVEFTEFGFNWMVCREHLDTVEFWKTVAGDINSVADETCSKMGDMKTALGLVKTTIPEITKMVTDVKNEDAIYELGYLLGRIE